ncbi:MAG: AAA-like domain-containing protein [Armatimonadetes bacterium]|nr:AAA-like domain-containing protein [Armatimonadota bacterium]
MGSIHDDVYGGHLAQWPREEALLRPFLYDFSVTWASKRQAYNTVLSEFFLKPDQQTTEAFAFSQEVMLVYSPFKSMEARVLQAADALLSDSPARGRVERLSFLLISEAADVKAWLDTYVATNQESSIVVAFHADDLRAHASDQWYVKNELNAQFLSRDLFDYRLPLSKDTYFYGRRDIIGKYVDSVKRSENRGLFGLRKTGKTSVLYKLERMARTDKLADFFFYDCKSPAIRKLRWYDLMGRMCAEIGARFGFQTDHRSYNEAEVADEFVRCTAHTKARKRLVFVFDEIEYISFVATQDVHWNHDFLDFWQTFWACQSRNRRISAIVAGVNPHVVEADMVGSVQNPLFGIFTPDFLRGFSLDEMSEMVRSLGRKMGLQFNRDALEYLHERYGGHPMLTRLACSVFSNRVTTAGAVRPFAASRSYLCADEDEREAELTFYCQHLVSQLRQFYPDEYAMLELLASGQVVDYMELVGYAEFTRHLHAYGLLCYDARRIPSIAIPAVSRYVGIDLARREGRKTILRVVPTDRRRDWLTRRVASISKDLRVLEAAIHRANAPSLFGVNSFPEADAFADLSVCDDDEAFDRFVNVCNRCFVEAIEVYGRSVGDKNYFWVAVKQAFPALFPALERIKLYRHQRLHLVLTSAVDAGLQRYLAQDLEGRTPSEVPSLYFQLQQCVLDGLLVGIQAELTSLSS